MAKGLCKYCDKPTKHIFSKGKDSGYATTCGSIECTTRWYKNPIFIEASRKRGLGNKQAFKHGMVGKPYYRSWNQMIQRCTNHKNSNYSNYGGRGITVCDKRRTFQGFYEDMGATRQEGLTIDRKDTNGNYNKENCKWSTKKEQSINKRNNVIIEYNGQKHILSERGRITGINTTTIKKRIKLGRPIEKCLTHKIIHGKMTD